MNSSGKVWLPGGLDRAHRLLLSVPVVRPMTRSLYRSLLEIKVAAMVDADPKAARRALEMSSESATELWSIAHERLVNEWASAIVRSEGMARLLREMTLRGMVVNAPEEPPNLLELLEQLA